MNGVTDDYIDFDDDRQDEEPEQEPEPGDCPYCHTAIRPTNYLSGGTFYHCRGCSCTWSNVGQIEHDRNIRLSAPLNTVTDGRIDEHLTAVDAAEDWYGGAPF